MPARYEAIRDALLKRHIDEAAAKKRAAMIYNATRKPSEQPVTGKKD